MAVVDHEALGADAITDLLMVNMKGPDYVAHAYGPDSPELKETLAELDRQVTRVLDAVDRKAGPRQRVVAVTADHGMPPEPRVGHRHYFEEVVDLIHRRFDPQGTAIVQYYGDPANSQLYVDTARLKALGVSLKDLATLLAAQEYYAAAFTEEEVLAAGRSLR
jgi:predicted AlkP superfamily pyrophosphatase or phosphodiesterase